MLAIKWSLGRGKVINFLLLMLLISSVGADEDFTTWTEVDPNNNLTQTSTIASYSLPDTAEAYLYKDYGLTDIGDGFFHCDFTQNLTINVSGGVIGVNAVDYFIWVLSNQSNGVSMLNPKDVQLISKLRDANTFNLTLMDANGEDSDSVILNLSQEYTLRIQRVKTSGFYSPYDIMHLNTINYSVRIYANKLIDTLSIIVENALPYRYIYLTGVRGSGSDNIQSGYVKNLDVSSCDTLTPTYAPLSGASVDSFSYLTETELLQHWHSSTSNITLHNSFVHLSEELLGGGFLYRDEDPLIASANLRIHDYSLHSMWIRDCMITFSLFNLTTSPNSDLNIPTTERAWHNVILERGNGICYVTLDGVKYSFTPNLPDPPFSSFFGFITTSPMSMDIGTVQWVSSGTHGGTTTTTMPPPRLKVEPSPFMVSIPKNQECKLENLYLTWTGKETISVSLYPTPTLSKHLRLPQKVIVSPDKTVTLPLKACLPPKLIGTTGNIKFIVIGFPEQVDLPVSIKRGKPTPPTHPCGNGICDQGENWFNCSEDCPFPQWLLLLLLLLILILYFR